MATTDDNKKFMSNGSGKHPAQWSVSFMYVHLTSLDFQIYTTPAIL